MSLTIKSPGEKTVEGKRSIFFQQVHEKAAIAAHAVITRLIHGFLQNGKAVQIWANVLILNHMYNTIAL
jgi:hypothetical protein